jgi:hypothetical protein
LTATADVTRRSWFLRAAPWIGWCVFFVPLTIVLHELGHYLAALWAGSPNPALHYSWTSPGDLAAKDASIGAVIGLAGPAVTVILSVFACAWILFRSPAHWAFALAVSAASRLVVAVPYTVLIIVVRLTGGSLSPPVFDEYKAGIALGWSGDALLASTAIVLVGALVCVGVKLPRGERSIAWPGLVIGTSLGWILWMTLLGPTLLP